MQVISRKCNYVSKLLPTTRVLPIGQIPNHQLTNHEIVQQQLPDNTPYLPGVPLYWISGLYWGGMANAEADVRVLSEALVSEPGLLYVSYF